MQSQVARFTTAVAYQTSLAVGIMLLPFALVARRMGVTLPVGRLVERAEGAYESTR
ncbi:hypothetical protein [Halocalculus aciditolerans]|uniref:Uncharacterized protein n=1 Tax=Halocalculus aciditolerans TaxID=1383812 RepID=A0A830FJR1_9EURY|nr:hypothetical protein [Halocalculus aciditolerans]GGL59321.1 hypothetical protein GCM10009039_16960 [Halocalculus aciditolerans]